VNDQDLTAKAPQRSLIRRRIGSAVSFGFGFFLTSSLASLVATYALQSFDAELGQLGTFQVGVLLDIAGSLLTTVAFGFGASDLRRFHSVRVAFLLGTMCSLSYIATGWAFGWFARSPGILVVVLFLVAVSLLAASMGRRARAT
jgi:hypothetical protein